MKVNRFKYLILFFIFYQHTLAKDVYFTRVGEISVFSSAPLEDIQAVNSQVTCVLDASTGNVAFRVPVPGFIFNNTLMQEHFNENYMESDKFPTAGFKGEIADWDSMKLSEEMQDITLIGKMTIHGVTKDISEKGQIHFMNNMYLGRAKFKITVADYGIEIPKIVRDNIAKIVDVTVELELKKK